MKRKTLSSAVILPTLLLALLVSCNKTNDSSTTSELPPSVSEEPNSSNEEKPSENKKGCKGSTAAIGMPLLLIALVFLKKRQYK